MHLFIYALRHLFYFDINFLSSPFLFQICSLYSGIYEIYHIVSLCPHDQKRAKVGSFEVVAESRERGIRPMKIWKAISVRATRPSSDYESGEKV